MKKIFNYIATIALVGGAFAFSACSDDDDDKKSVTYEQEDQMGRPAINTVFIASGAPKDAFNQALPSTMGATYASVIEAKLTAFGYTQNALGHDKATFAGILATDVLNVALTGTTTFFDGTNVLTGRALGDDVIDTELLLIFGGPTGGSNAGLTSDNVDGNDKTFLGSFPYLAAPF